MTDVEDPKSAELSSSHDADQNVIDIKPRIKRKNRRVLRNYYLVPNGKGKYDKFGLDAIEILESLRELFGDWPRCIAGRLFIPPKGELCWLDKPGQLIGWLSSEGIGIDWRDEAAEGINKTEFVGALQRIATPHVAFSKLPHFPPRPGYYYVPLDLPADSQGAFDTLLSFFNPATDTDGELLKAAFMTPFWGGEPGSRPAFVFTGLDDDKDGGRGVGKTILTELIASLAGGSIDFSTKIREIEDAKKRILTSKGQRIIRFDNVKTACLSNGDIEAMITGAHISGHRMYAGDGSIPNDFTYLFTFNDASFSKDLAQRAIPIKLKRPLYTGDWEKDIRNFIRENQLSIIAGIKECFALDPIQSTEHLRFGQWTKEVLNRVTQNPDLVQEIKSTQEVMDEDDNTSEEIASILLYQIGKYRLATYGQKSNIPALEVEAPFMVRCGLLAQWVSQGLNQKLSVRAVNNLVRRAKLHGYLGERVHDGYTYFVWRQTMPEEEEPLIGAWKIFEDSKSGPMIPEDAFVEFRLDLPK